MEIPDNSISTAMLIPKIAIAKPNKQSLAGKKP
jgi:hypothetical protein